MDDEGLAFLFFLAWYKHGSQLYAGSGVGSSCPTPPTLSSSFSWAFESYHFGFGYNHLCFVERADGSLRSVDGLHVHKERRLSMYFCPVSSRSSFLPA